MADAAGADIYFADTLRNARWISYPPNDREAAITEAASMFSRLSFRRRAPAARLDNAAYEQALHLLIEKSGADDPASAIMKGVRSRSLDGASESYAELTNLPGYVDGMLFSPLALSWIKEYLESGGVRAGRIMS